MKKQDYLAMIDEMQKYGITIAVNGVISVAFEVHANDVTGIRIHLNNLFPADIITEITDATRYDTVQKKSKNCTSMNLQIRNDFRPLIEIDITRLD